jgi:long-chain acyl-CoA synthetase
VGVVLRAASERSEYTYAELDLGARRAAADLRAAGMRAGDRVALLAGNSASFITAWFGIAYAGGTVVPVPILSAVPEVAFRLRHARCRALVFDRERKELAQKAARGEPGVERIAMETLGTGAGDAPSPPAAVDPGSAAMILYTSGTTGQAKGALISHRTLVEHTAGLAEHALRLGAEDRVMGVLPLTHSYGWRMVPLATFHAGCRCVLVPRFDAAGSLAIMQEEAITWIPAVPTMLAAWAALEEGEPPPHLRWCLSAGSPLADETMHRAERRLCVEIRQGYGMTEATFSTINAPPDRRAIGSVGRPAHGVEVRVVDEEERDVPAGQTGEVLVRGKNLMSGYLDDPDATAEALRGGWMHSGDVGRLDEEGRLYVVDRIKDMIIRGGNNVYPSEVEAAIAEHPAVREVAVVGRPDPYYGEEVVAVVVPSEATLTLEELRAFASERLARNKVPREWALVDALPLGPSRKVLKRELRDRIADGRLAPTALAPGNRPDPGLSHS